jgi:PEGA domain
MSLPRLFGFALALLTFVATVVAPRDARCDPAGPRAYPVYVLAIDTDDADDQSEALTGALRSRVRGAPGWSLSETTLTLTMLTAALRCPKVPDAQCLVKIGDQLKADRYVWGTMQKVPGNMVKVDLHLWARNKPAETNASDSYTENLKDQNDERLQRVAQRLFDRLTGSTSGGSLVVHAGDGGGVVMVDGQRRAALEKGDATIDLPAGTHAVEVRVPGYAWSKESVTISAGKEARLTVSLVAEGGPSGETGPSTGTSGRKIAGWAAVGVGAALLIAGGVEGIVYLGKKSDQDSDGALFSGNACTNPVFPAPTNSGYARAVQAAKDSCKRYDDAKSVSALGWIFGAAGAVATSVGLYLVLSDPGPSSAEKSAPKFEDRAAKNSGPKMLLVPEISPAAQGLWLQGTF